METEAEIGLFEVGARQIQKPHPGRYGTVQCCMRVRDLDVGVQKYRTCSKNISKNEDGNAHSFILVVPLTQVNHNVQISTQANQQAIARPGC
jgi:hypothetical protein